MAEAILANLNRYRGLLNGDDIPRTTEIILSFDDEFEDFSRKLQQLSKEWEASGPRHRPCTPETRTAQPSPSCMRRIRRSIRSPASTAPSPWCS